MNAKLRVADMDDLERPGVEGGTHYSVEAVPWVQYYTGTTALHGAFWHRRFGHPRSHGCINLAPADAHWLFRFTEPDLAPESGEIHSERGGTWVQIR